MAHTFGDYFRILSIRENKGDLHEFEELLAPGNAWDQATSRLYSLLRPKCQTVIVERDYIDNDYRSGYARFYYLRHHDTGRRSTRLHLIGCRIKESDLASPPDHFTENYLGFAVLRPLPAFRLGRTILTHKLLPPFPRGVTPYLTCQADFRANIAGTEVTVRGCPWMEQDTLVAACASASLWMCSWYMSHKYAPDFRPYSTPEITDMATQHLMGTGRPMPSKGLTFEQMVYAATRMGYEAVHYDCRHDVTSIDQVRQLIYYYVESEIPVILSLVYPDKATGHAVTVVGHSYDSSMKPIVERFRDTGPAGNRISLSFSRTSDFVPGFIVQDDAGGPFRVLKLVDWATAEKQYLTRTITKNTKLSQLESTYRLLALLDPGSETQRIALLNALLVPLPPGVALEGGGAESNSVRLLAGWFTRMVYRPRVKTLLRTFLQPSNVLKSTWREGRGMPEDLAQELRKHLMSKWVWVTEVADADEMRETGRVMGQIIQDSAGHPNPSGFFDLLALNMPGYLGVIPPNEELHTRPISMYSTHPAFRRGWMV